MLTLMITAVVLGVCILTVISFSISPFLGHGTHVAGIIAAQPGNKFNISGVAYGATLSAYRVFGCDGYTSDDSKAF